MLRVWQVGAGVPGALDDLRPRARDSLGAVLVMPDGAGTHAPLRHPKEHSASVCS